MSATSSAQPVLIYDTTLRDGSQGEGVSFSLQDKLNIAIRLAEIGIEFIEGGYPLSNEKDVAFFEQIRKHDLGKSKVCAFGMTRRRSMKAEEDPGMKALVAAKTPCCTLVGKTWDFHVTEVLRATLDENLAMIGESAEFLAGHSELIYDAEHFFDGYNANPEYAIKTLQAAAASGAKWLALCDTNGGTLPERVAEVTRIAKEAMASYDVGIGIHCHNDCELAVANSLAAVDVGATQVQGTINGIGERCGNVDLIAVIANLALKKENTTVLGGRPLQQLTELSRFVYETANLQWRNNQPFVGQSAFAHKGGMHVHAINKAASTYEHIDPTLVGNERRILVSELSGRSNIEAIAGKYNVGDDKELQNKILAEVVRLENQGYQFESATASFDLLIRRVSGKFRPHFETIKYRVVAGDRDVKSQVAFAEAIIKLQVGDTLWFDAAEGHGPVNALDAGLRKALAGAYPVLSEISLIDYKVRVVDSGSGTAASIRVNIESTDGKETWGTIGVSDNIIEASWQALVDSVEYKLHRSEA
ncbi:MULTISPECIES: citramalate synthase [Rhodopirellula]|jgi:2-isopropylmalate synthase|uniref:Citramalate synthase n=1 Tax=Rhodopirellula europaea SH398 TaxID=1263868 RepID=M5S7J2_9BACT|nr:MULTISPECIES: citramalate synthase [Rhodopirellula]EMI27613.1 alpha-isopropylmalate/homocitrate synthase family transferase [Rhodopirellula europaea SH398]